MVQKNCNCIISYGSRKSNLNRVIANMSRAEGIPCYVVSPEDNNSETEETFNSKLVKDTGAYIVSCNRNNVANTIESIINQCMNDGLTPYYINGDKYGKGNKEVPAKAYIKAYEEILKYEKIIGIKFDYIFHASGTGMTQAGLICGRVINRDKKKIVGISIARSHELGVKSIEDIIYSNFKDSTLRDVVFDINFIDHYICGGYGEYNNQIIDIVRSIFNTEGIPLDTTYTGNPPEK